MLSLLNSLKQTQTKSVLGLKSALSSQRSSVKELIQTNLIQQTYLDSGSSIGPLGYPVAEVQFNGTQALRQYRGGDISIFGDVTSLLPRLSVSVKFLGFRCLEESDWDQSSTHDEPYFIISVESGRSTPVVRKFGRFTGVDSGTEEGIGDLLIDDVAPNPMTIRAIVYENDDGDPDETAKNIQDEIVKLSQEAGKLASAAEAADGAGIGPSAAAGTIGSIAAGPIGALISVGIVSVLGLGDDFVGQAIANLFNRPENVGTPPPLGQFQDSDYNCKIFVNGKSEGSYDLFFDVLVVNIQPPVTVPAPPK